VRPLVVDASVLVELLLGGTAAAAAEAAVAGAELLAPAHLDAEVLSVLVRLARRGERDAERLETAVYDLADAPIERVPLDALLPAAWAARDNVTGYDAPYVALARVLQCPLLTLDRRLAAAPGLGVTVTVLDAR
jgi:predicted nucleic acid-binding protein